MVRVLLLGIIATLLLSCQDYTFRQVCPQKVQEAQRNVAAAAPTPADILFVVDNSGSMADEQRNLADNFSFFINQIAGAGGDYRIAIVTTDQFSDKEKGGLMTFTYAPNYPYDLVEFSGSTCTNLDIDIGCFRGPNASTRIITSDMPKTDQISAFQANVLVGSCGSGRETGLKAMIDGLEKSSSGCNQGFLRDSSNLVVIFVSDEEDNDNTPVEQYVTDIARFKDYSRLRVAAIVGSVDGVASDCNIQDQDNCGTLCQNPPPSGSQTACDPNTSNCPPGEYCSNSNVCENEELRYWTSQQCLWCSYYNAPDCCSALAGNRYVNFALQVEARVNAANSAIPISSCRGEPGTRIACLVDSICQDNFGQTLERIARELVISNEYTLTPPAVYPAGVAVRIKGGRFPEAVQLKYGDDFQVSEDGATLNIVSADKTPRDGEELEIYFVIDQDNNVDVPRGACGVE